MTNELDFMEVDCRKTRAAEEEWRRKHPRLPRKQLSPAAQRLRITGKAQKGVLVDFAKVRYAAVAKFANECGLSVEEFRADPNEFKQWALRRKNVKVADEVEQSTMRKIDIFHKRLRGYWELYHQSTSRRWASEISVSLVHVDGIDANQSAVRCELHDGNRLRQYFHLKGHVAKLGNFLHWELQHASEEAGFHGYCYYPTVEKYPGFTLFGVFLSISGDDKFDYPVAAKGALRFIGETSSEAIEHSIIDLSATSGDPAELLRKRVGGYLRDLQTNDVVRPEIFVTIERDILPGISNLISADSVPIALTVPR
ncbi:hypothetical protein ACVWWO_005623 [Bradyrhizobium sp. F1.13.1]